MSLLLVSAIVYFGVNIGRTYFNYFQFRDRMKVEARFAQHRSDATIARRLREYADSLGLPEAAHKVHVRRRRGTIEIWSEYYESVELPLMVKEFYFHPQAVGTF
jgi:hypothetical protein